MPKTMSHKIFDISIIQKLMTVKPNLDGSLFTFLMLIIYVHNRDMTILPFYKLPLVLLLDRLI